MNNDLISKRAAIDALDKEKPTPFVNEDGSIDPFGAGRQNQWYRDGIAIMNLSSAQKKGKWVDPAAVDVYRCSVCEEYTKLEVPRLFYHYCPNCGAEMDEEEPTMEEYMYRQEGNEEDGSL